MEEQHMLPKEHEGAAGVNAQAEDVTETAYCERQQHNAQALFSELDFERFSVRLQPLQLKGFAGLLKSLLLPTVSDKIATELQTVSEERLDVSDKASKQCDGQEVVAKKQVDGKVVDKDSQPREEATLDAFDNEIVAMNIDASEVKEFVDPVSPWKEPDVCVMVLEDSLVRALGATEGIEPDKTAAKLLEHDTAAIKEDASEIVVTQEVRPSIMFEEPYEVEEAAKENITGKAAEELNKDEDVSTDPGVFEEEIEEPVLEIDVDSVGPVIPAKELTMPLLMAKDFDAHDKAAEDLKNVKEIPSNPGEFEEEIGEPELRITVVDSVGPAIPARELTMPVLMAEDSDVHDEAAEELTKYEEVSIDPAVFEEEIEEPALEIDVDSVGPVIPAKELTMPLLMAKDFDAPDEAAEELNKYEAPSDPAECEIQLEEPELEINVDSVGPVIPAKELTMPLLMAKDFDAHEEAAEELTKYEEVSADPAVFEGEIVEPAHEIDMDSVGPVIPAKELTMPVLMAEDSDAHDETAEELNNYELSTDPAVFEEELEKSELEISATDTEMDLLEIAPRASDVCEVAPPDLVDHVKAVDENECELAAKESVERGTEPTELLEPRITAKEPVESDEAIEVLVVCEIAPKGLEQDELSPRDTDTDIDTNTSPENFQQIGDSATKKIDTNNEQCITTPSFHSQPHILKLRRALHYFSCVTTLRSAQRKSEECRREYNFFNSSVELDTILFPKNVREACKQLSSAAFLKNEPVVCHTTLQAIFDMKFALGSLYHKAMSRQLKLSDSLVLILEANAKGFIDIADELAAVMVCLLDWLFEGDCGPPFCRYISDLLIAFLGNETYACECAVRAGMLLKLQEILMWGLHEQFSAMCFTELSHALLVLNHMLNLPQKLKLEKRFIIQLKSALFLSPHAKVTELVAEALLCQARHTDILMLLTKEGLWEVMSQLINNFALHPKPKGAQGPTSAMYELMLAQLEQSVTLRLLSVDRILHDLHIWLESEHKQLICVAAKGLGYCARNANYFTAMINYGFVMLLTEKLFVLEQQQQLIATNARVIYPILRVTTSLMLPKQGAHVAYDVGLVHMVLTLLLQNSDILRLECYKLLLQMLEHLQEINSPLIRNEEFLYQLVVHCHNRNNAVCGAAQYVLLWLARHPLVDELPAQMPDFWPGYSNWRPQKPFYRYLIVKLIMCRGLPELLIDRLVDSHVFEVQVQAVQALVCLCMIFYCSVLVYGSDSYRVLYKRAVARLMDCMIQSHVVSKVAKLLSNSGEQLTLPQLKELGKLYFVLKDSKMFEMDLKYFRIKHLLSECTLLKDVSDMEAACESMPFFD